MQGFVTIATGDEQYFRLASNLLKSYRLSTQNPKPFCILTDKQNCYTDLFDDVIVVENVTRSFLDKLQLVLYAPYDETIFIDADCLVYRDLNSLFSIFSEASDFSCFGEVLSLDSKEGWFTNEQIGKYKSKIDYTVNLHGGIYFIRKSEKLHDLYQIAMDIANEFEKYSFHRSKRPTDEAIYAMAMAICKFKPVAWRPECYAWLRKVKIDKVDFFTRSLAYRGGTVCDSGWMIHFGHIWTIGPLYCIESAKINYEYEYHKKWNILQSIVYNMKGRLYGWIGLCTTAWKKRKKIYGKVKQLFISQKD